MITPALGYLACGDVGEGKMPEPEVLFEYLVKALTPKDMVGLKVLVTAGPTQESIDPVRYISNHSTGKMGYAIAKAAMRRGAEVTLVTGKTGLTPPIEVEVVGITSAGLPSPLYRGRKDQEKRRRRHVHRPGAHGGYSGLFGRA